MALSNAERQQRLRDKRKAEGLVKRNVWIKPEHDEEFKKIVDRFFKKFKDCY